MQKITTALLLAAGVCLNAASARAIENDYKPYLGVNYAYGEVRAEGAHAYHNSGSFNLGSVYNKYFGTELFYQYSDKHKFDAGSDLKNTAFQAYGLDLMAYLPLGCEGRWRRRRQWASANIRLNTISASPKTGGIAAGATVSAAD